MKLLIITTVLSVIVSANVLVSSDEAVGVWVEPTSGITVGGTYCSQGGFIPASVDLCVFE